MPLVTSKTRTLARPFTTEGGATFDHPVVAYEEYGDETKPVVLVTHGGMSKHHAAGRYSEGDLLPGFWDPLIGPGRALDTTRYRIICANALGGVFGSLSPASLNPATGTRYGPNFPAVTFIDMARFTRAFLDDLGVKQLALVAGPSMGALLALQLAALYPDDVQAAVGVGASGRLTPMNMAYNQLVENMIRMAPEFQGGWYDRPLLSLKHVWQVTRFLFTHDLGLEELAWTDLPEGPEAQAARDRVVSRYVTGNPDLDMRDRDPNCTLMLVDALRTYNLGVGAASYEDGVARIRCPVLLMNADTDALIPPRFGKEVADILNSRRPGQATAVVLGSKWGHMACLREHQQIAEHLAEFLGDQSVP